VNSFIFRCFLVIAITSSSFAFGQGSPSDSTISSRLPARKLAEGVLTVVPPDQDFADTSIGPLDLDLVEKHPELVWTAPDFPENKPFFGSSAETLLELSRNITFRRDVWSLQIAFKPVRLIEVEIPNAAGQIERKVVWYMVYRVHYPGLDVLPVADPDSNIASVPQSGARESVRFLPRFSIVSKERNLMVDASILPSAKAAIEAKERVGQPLLDSIEIAKIDIPHSADGSKGVWGVATWTDVDPRLDFFAVDVRGLTNAYRIKLDGASVKQYERKTLRIFHWRAGDAIDEVKDRIRLGIPAAESPERVQHYLDKFSLQERLDYQWIYR
jgi:hypothetical protein